MTPTVSQVSPIAKAASVAPPISVNSLKKSPRSSARKAVLSTGQPVMT